MAEEFAQARRLRIWKGLTPEQRDYDRFVAGVIPQGASWNPETPWGREHGRTRLYTMTSYESDSCSCHINPPCSYCTSRVDCDQCGELVREDDLNEHVDEKHPKAAA